MYSVYVVPLRGFACVFAMDQLPDELCLRILRYLPPRELNMVSLLCWRWRHLASDDVLWKRLCHKHWLHIPQTLKHLSDAISHYANAPYRRLWPYIRTTVDHWRAGRYSVKHYGHCFSSVAVLAVAPCTNEKTLVDSTTPVTAFVAPRCCYMPLLRADISRSHTAAVSTRPSGTAVFTELHHHKHLMRTIVANGDWLATVSSSKVKLLHTASGSQQPVLIYKRAQNARTTRSAAPMGGLPTDLRYFSVGDLGKSRLVAGTADGCLCLFDIEKNEGDEPFAELAAPARLVKHIKFDMVGGNINENILFAGYELESRNCSSDIAVWDLRESTAAPVMRWSAHGKVFSLHRTEQFVMFATNDTFDPPGPRCSSLIRGGIPQSWLLLSLRVLHGL